MTATPPDDPLALAHDIREVLKRRSWLSPGELFSLKAAAVLEAMAERERLIRAALEEWSGSDAMAVGEIRAILTDTESQP